MARRPSHIKIEDLIQKLANGRWNFTGTKPTYQGYHRTYYNGHSTPAHRVFYEKMRGAIPKGMTIDHLCRNRACVNPDHLEPITAAVNTLRGMGLGALNKRKTHCKYGHPFSGENLVLRSGKRGCRTCERKKR